MYAILTDPLEKLQPAVSDIDGLPRLRCGSVELLSAISEQTRLRHARYCGVASAIGEIAVRSLAPFAQGENRALLTACVDPHQAIAKTFGRRLHEAGPRRLNPIMFPHTLPSATAVTLGAQFGAHVCAIALDGPGSLRRALSTADMLLGAGRADTVLLFVCIVGASFDLPDPDAEIASIGVLLCSQPFAGCRVRVQPQRAATLRDGSSQSSNLVHDIRSVMQLAMELPRFPSSQADSVLAAGHMFEPYE